MLDTWLDDETMQSIAAENNLAETAFIVAREDGYDLRWFTPAVEVDLSRDILAVYDDEASVRVIKSGQCVLFLTGSIHL